VAGGAVVFSILSLGMLLLKPLVFKGLLAFITSSH
jgi:hypothetical protein